MNNNFEMSYCIFGNHNKIENSQIVFISILFVWYPAIMIDCIEVKLKDIQ